MVKKKASPRKNKVGQNQFFYLIDGSVVKDLFELADAFDRMSDDVFYYHVTQERNDFYNWVKGVFNKTKLAEHILTAPSKERCQIAILRHLMKR